MLASFLTFMVLTLGQAAVPNLAGDSKSDYGVIAPNWQRFDHHRVHRALQTAIGRIRDDGKVQLLWTDFASGDRIGLSVYHITPHGLVRRVGLGRRDTHQCRRRP